MSNPDSRVKRIEMLDFHEDKIIDRLWHKDKKSEFHVMQPEELPKGIKLRPRYRTVILTPKVFCS